MKLRSHASHFFFWSDSECSAIKVKISRKIKMFSITKRGLVMEEKEERRHGNRTHSRQIFV